MKPTSNSSSETEVLQKIESSFTPSEKEIIDFKKEVLKYLETMVEDNLRKVISEKKDNGSPSKSANDFFRKRNRYRATRKLLLHLVSMIGDISLIQIENKLNEKSFIEFKKLIIFHTNLLKEPDVIEVMIKEFENISQIKRKSLWFYKGRMRSSFNEINQLISQAEKPALADYKKLFTAIEKISSFWFFVKRDKFSKVRTSDIYLYKLVKILNSRLDKQ